MVKHRKLVILRTWRISPFRCCDLISLIQALLFWLCLYRINRSSWTHYDDDFKKSFWVHRFCWPSGIHCNGLMWFAVVNRFDLTGLHQGIPLLHWSVLWLRETSWAMLHLTPKRALQSIWNSWIQSDGDMAHHLTRFGILVTHSI